MKRRYGQQRISDASGWGGGRRLRSRSGGADPAAVPAADEVPPDQGHQLLKCIKAYVLP